MFLEQLKNRARKSVPCFDPYEALKRLPSLYWVYLVVLTQGSKIYFEVLANQSKQNPCKEAALVDEILATENVVQGVVFCPLQKVEENGVEKFELAFDAVHVKLAHFLNDVDERLQTLYARFVGLKVQRKPAGLIVPYQSGEMYSFYLSLVPLIYLWVELVLF